MYYPQTKEDNKTLETFKDIIGKYTYKISQELYIKKHNSLYPRLKDSKKRGKAAALEIIDDLCHGLIDTPPFSIIYDIMNKYEITYDHKADLYCCEWKLSFINLDTNIPILNQNNKLSMILDLIKQSKFNGDELNEISKYVMWLPVSRQ